MRRALVVLLLLAACASNAAREPVPVVYDTDMGNDIDDALALAMLHALESRGEARLIAVTITKDNTWAAPYIDLVNHFYQRPNIPIGMIRDGKTPEDSAMIREPSERRGPNNTPLYPRRIQAGRDAPDAVRTIREALEKEKDGSVVVVQVGFSTNLARLLAAPGGTELVKRKVKLLSVMAGQFPAGPPEYNVKTDIPSAKKVFNDWPAPVVASGYEIGDAILFPARSIEEDFAYVENHPVVDAYRAYKKMPYDRQTWDLTSVLYAVRPDQNYFSLSPPGRIVVDDEGKTRLEPSANGPHRYLIVDEIQKVRVREALILLASQPPKDR